MTRMRLPLFVPLRQAIHDPVATSRKQCRPGMAPGSRFWRWCGDTRALTGLAGHGMMDSKTSAYNNDQDGTPCRHDAYPGPSLCILVLACDNHATQVDGVRQTVITWIYRKVAEKLGSPHLPRVEPEQLPGSREPASCKAGPMLTQGGTDGTRTKIRRY